MIDQHYDPTSSSPLFGSDLDTDNITNETTPDESWRQPMRVVVFASQKGGSGKTTLCGQLAVEAERAGAGPVAMIDTDPQGSLADWWNARTAETPTFVKTSFARMKEDLEELRARGTKLVFIDTPPAVTDTIKAVVGYADLVVIPTRPSPHDLRAVGATVDIIEGLGKPLVFAVNGATRRARITGEAAVALSQHGTVAPVTVHQRVDFATSMIDGRTVNEINQASRAAEEIDGLWQYLSGCLDKLERRTERLPFDGLDRRYPNHGRPFAGPVARPTFGRRVEYAAIAAQIAE
jgi:chromosome partitioning protein